MKKSEPKSVILYFQVHQPRRLRNFTFLDIGGDHNYFDDETDKKILTKIAESCYLPTTELLRDLCRRVPGVKLTFSISGVALNHFAKYVPGVIDGLDSLYQAGCMELLGETSHHSLASITSPQEFKSQMLIHKQMLSSYFNASPIVCRNTELIYSNSVANVASELGFKGILCDDAHPQLARYNAHQVHRQEGSDLAVIMRNNELSDDIGFRFNSTNELGTRRYLEKIHRTLTNGNIVTLGFDYETFGEHIGRGADIDSFMINLLTGLAESPDTHMVFPSEMIEKAQGSIEAPFWSSWADKAKDLSAWSGNEMQIEALEKLYRLEEKVLGSADVNLLETWRNLQTSDHFYYMCTKDGDDGNVHKYFSPYSSPYEAFINYMNVLQDFSQRVENAFEIAAAGAAKEYERRHAEIPTWAREQYAEDFSHNSLLER
jgi:alpha-amylase